MFVRTDGRQGRTLLSLLTLLEMLAHTVGQPNRFSVMTPQGGGSQTNTLKGFAESTPHLFFTAPSDHVHCVLTWHSNIQPDALPRKHHMHRPTDSSQVCHDVTTQSTQTKKAHVD